MSRPHTGLADFTSFAATRKWQLLMTAALVSFVVCHVIVQRTPPMSATSADDVFEWQLLHLLAEVLRFALPYAFLAWGMSSYWRSRGKVKR